jgi:hypothetical protein
MWHIGTKGHADNSPQAGSQLTKISVLEYKGITEAEQDLSKLQFTR